MVTLQSRWKQRRSWNVRRYITIVVVAGLCVALVYAVKGLTVWLTEVVPAAVPRIVSFPAETSAADQYVGTAVGEFEREFNVGDYTCVLPNDFELDVLPQPGDIPRGGRYTGVRFRAARDEAAQLYLVIVAYPKKTGEDEEEEVDIQARLEAALDRLFARLSHNAEVVRLARGDVKSGELDGMPFARCSFSGDFRAGRHAARVRRSGMALATVDGRREIFCYSLCDRTAHRDDRQLLERSVLTLRPAGFAREASADDPETEGSEMGDSETDEAESADSQAAEPPAE
ncbi:MAG TPA: hypothetical protein VG125_10420 [Pirellulales bacterium]|jgi:hypothetical protein|nr:hypothetical protein [Pirellulales bacterium]